MGVKRFKSFNFNRNINSGPGLYMKNLRLFEDFNDTKGIITVYHGGEYIDDLREEGVLFTTDTKENAEWYVERGGWLIELEIKLGKILKSGFTDFKEKWIPILDKINIDYEYEEYKGSYSFTCYEILKHGGYIEDNIFDLLYIPKFREEVIKQGYDTIVGDDSLENYTIPVYIPLKKENIKIIKSEEIYKY